MSITVRHEDDEAQLEDGATALDALKALEAIRGQVVAATVDGDEWDLDRSVPDGAEVAPVYADTEQGRAILRHSVAHLMAQAVTDLYPGAKWAIGPPIEDGFYYDFDVEEPFTAEDLDKIEARMRELMEERQRFVREELDRDEALELFADQPYKREIIERVDASEVEADAHGQEGPVFTVYRNVRGGNGDGEDAWVDLCRGPHLPTSDRVPAFKLLRTAGAYWRGREDQPMLQRIYGTAWESRTALKQHLEQLEEAKKRDHRKLGRELELAHFPEEIGPGMSIFLPKGALVRKEMEDWIRDEVLARGYDAVYTPHIAKEDLWQISGHLDNYAELMYPGMEIDEDHRYRLKPMNCPFHILAYQSRIRSYRELPIRLSELGTVYRYEKSGVVNGMLRARGFTQDDSHIFCTPEQVTDEIQACVEFGRDIYLTFGMGEPSRYAISTRPEKSIGADDDWEVAERGLVQAMERLGLDYEIDEGEGAFYGPKIDIHARDAIGREWQMGTVQFDFTLPERFDVTYVGEDGQEHRPYMVHRALFGSIERFFAVVLESTNGAFPTWLAPVHVTVLTVANEFADYAAEVADALRSRGVRVEVDDSDDTLGNKIRKAQTSKIPYSLIVGGNEAEARTVSIRPYEGDQRKGVVLDEFVEEVADEIHEGRTARSRA
ncbi:MAG: threonine--tRNA ligase [Nitriliruptorales bacterium]|nr:threonine--tRNA ligase [Nitriliruptorales bacterium]